MVLLIGGDRYRDLMQSLLGEPRLDDVLLLSEAREEEGEQDAEDHDHSEELDEREAALLRGMERAPHQPRSL